MLSTHILQNKGIKMKNISLVKLTFVVLVSTFASSLVIAADKIEKPTSLAEVQEAPTKTKIQFSALDADDNGLLNSVEAEKSETLNNAFSQIDSNSDAQISPDELSAFFKKIN